MKQLSAAERKSFQELAPNFFAYLGRAMRCGQPTCLAKIMGVFTVRPFMGPAVLLLQTHALVICSGAFQGLQLALLSLSPSGDGRNLPSGTHV